LGEVGVAASAGEAAVVVVVGVDVVVVVVVDDDDDDDGTVNCLPMPTFTVKLVPMSCCHRMDTVQKPSSLAAVVCRTSLEFRP